jgi:hypothetical protein
VVRCTCKLTSQLKAMCKILMYDRLVVLGWPHEGMCSVCLVEIEAIDHFTHGCVFARGVLGAL